MRYKTLGYLHKSSNICDNIGEYGKANHVQVQKPE